MPEKENQEGVGLAAVYETIVPVVCAGRVQVKVCEGSGTVVKSAAARELFGDVKQQSPHTFAGVAGNECSSVVRYGRAYCWPCSCMVHMQVVALWSGGATNDSSPPTPRSSTTGTHRDRQGSHHHVHTTPIR